MAERRRLEIVDDPVLRASSTRSPARQARPRPPAPDAAEAPTAPMQAQGTPPDTPAAPAQAQGTAPEAASEQPAPEAQPPVAEPPVAAPQSFRGEQKRAVFGRVPRSLSRRLERAVVELREDMEDLTQEQLLAALLSRHVNPSEPASLAALAETVRAYRDQL